LQKISKIIYTISLQWFFFILKCFFYSKMYLW
jgi:hypothetical protein